MNTDMHIKYTDICSCFMVSDTTVYFWDERKDQLIKEIKVEKKEQGIDLMNTWVNRAPAEISCRLID